MGGVIRRASYNSKGSIATVLVIFVCFAASYILFMLSESWKYRESESLFKIMALALAVVGIMDFLALIAANKMYICVCNNGVYGVGRKFGNIVQDPFELYYYDITNVTVTAAGALIIESRSVKHTLVVENATEICRMISNMIEPYN